MFRRAPRLDLGNARAISVIARQDLNPQGGVSYLSFIDELIRHPLSKVGRDGKPEADRAALARGFIRQRGNHRVHTNDIAVHIHQRTAGIAGVNGGVSLDGIDKRRLATLLGRTHRTVLCGYDARSHRGIESKRRTDGDYLLANRYRIRVAELEVRQVLHVLDLDDGDIRIGIGSHEIGFVLATIVQGHLHDATLFRTGDDVVVGQHVTIGRNDRARAFRSRGPSSGLNGYHGRQNLGGNRFHRTFLWFLTHAIGGRLAVKSLVNHGRTAAGLVLTHDHTGNGACCNCRYRCDCGRGAKSDLLFLLRLRRQRRYPRHGRLAGLVVHRPLLGIIALLTREAGCFILPPGSTRLSATKEAIAGRGVLPVCGSLCILLVDARLVPALGIGSVGICGSRILLPTARLVIRRLPIVHAVGFLRDTVRLTIIAAVVIIPHVHRNTMPRFA